MNEKLDFYQGVLIFIGLFTFIGILFLLPSIIDSLEVVIKFFKGENTQGLNSAFLLVIGTLIIICGYIISIFSIIWERYKNK